MIQKTEKKFIKSKRYISDTVAFFYITLSVITRRTQQKMTVVSDATEIPAQYRNKSDRNVKNKKY